MAREKQVAFRADGDKVDRLDDLIWQMKTEGYIDRETSRSDVMRDCIDEKIAEFEEALEEGNPKAGLVIAD